MKKIPIVELTIDDSIENETGVDYVALVDMPAIKKNWIAFNEVQEIKKMQFEVIDEDKRIISGPLMIADLPILRRDRELGEYYAVFRANTIMQIVQKFFKSRNNSNVNIMHNPNMIVDGVYMFESFIIDEERGMLTPKGFDVLSNGSWFGSFKVENDKVWEEIKQGIFSGFSVEGPFMQEVIEEKSQSEIDKIIDLLDSLTNS